MNWSAQQYSRFEAERTRPVRDLVSAIPNTPAQVHTAIDLGCGPGNSTEVLIARFPQAHTTGLDNDADMIANARQRLPGTTFTQADIASWHATQSVDVILANASLQWLPQHEQLYPQLVAQLSAGGSLAIQTPDNLQEPAHVLAREAASTGPWARHAVQTPHPPRHDIRWYYALLKPLCSHIDVWRTTYMHPLPGHEAVVEWFKSTALRPYLAPLNEIERSQYLSTYLEAIRKAYPMQEDGTVLLPFPRLFIVATR